MAHNLEVVNGSASFAYNTGNGDPWHRLGTPMDGLQTVDEMLAAAHADRFVQKFPVYAMLPEGMMELADRAATFAPSADENAEGFDQWLYLGVVGNDYPVVQNRQALELALDVVGASDGDAVVDTCGVLDGFKRFFAFIDLGTLVIDPLGIADAIAKGLTVYTSHDGTQALTLANTDIRAVCENTVNFGLRTARATFTCRHDGTIEQRIAEARHALRMSVDWSEAFRAMAEQLVAIPAGHDELTMVADDLWPLDKADTPRKVTNREVKVNTLHELFRAPTNAPAVGENAWAVYNTVGEYLDHHRKTSADARANASMSLTGLIPQRKQRVAELLLAAAN